MTEQFTLNTNSENYDKKTISMNIHLLKICIHLKYITKDSIHLKYIAKHYHMA